MTIGRIIAALLLPPLGIFLAEGVSRNFWIGLVLTCLGYIPGIIFAFVVLAKNQRTGQAVT
ncbi:MAG TPA: YqaE/Pmp3 family membrane protein [Allosphingosinicella sp.]|nr:YqaE/Pmp3 family membrane protein [Allosphingosinicella sp.]